MAIPTEPVGSIPRPDELIEASGDLQAGRITAARQVTRKNMDFLYPLICGRPSRKA